MKETNKKWTNNKAILKISAVLIAFVCWFSVAMTGTTTRTEIVKNIPINLDLQEKVLAELGLNIIEVSGEVVAAEIVGERVAVSKATVEELTATVQLPSDFSGPDNTYKLELLPQNSSTLLNKNYKVTKYNPPYITVKLDKIDTRVLPIKTEIQGEIKLAEGYIQEKDMVLTPSEVIVSGPQVELDKIDSAVIGLFLDKELAKNYATEENIKLLDAQGNEIDLENHHLNIDNDKAQVVISVLKEAELPLAIEFLSIPRNFPIEQLNFTLSDKKISVAGPVDSISQYSEIVLGYVDVSQISKNKNSFIFEVNLPDKFVNLANIRIVTVQFDSANWQDTSLNVDTINIVNIPEGYDVKLVTQQIVNVKLVGSSEAIGSLGSEDLVAELDLAEKKDLTDGQYQYTVKISAPAKGLVWANGEYSVVIKVIKTDIDV